MTEKTTGDYDFFGLWLRENDKGTKFLSGFDKETKRSYLVFKDGEGEDAVRRLVTSVDNGDLVALGEFKNIKTDKGAMFHVMGDIFKLSENQFYEEAVKAGKNAPEYTLKILKSY